MLEVAPRPRLTREQILDLVCAERAHQDNTHGSHPHPPQVWANLISAWNGLLHMELIRAIANDGTPLTRAHVQKRFVEICALALAALEMPMPEEGQVNYQAPVPGVIPEDLDAEDWLSEPRR